MFRTPLRISGGIGVTRLVSSKPNGSNRGNGKGKKVNLSGLLSKLREESDQDLERIKPKNLIEKWKEVNEQERIDIRSKLFNSAQETEKTDVKSGNNEGLKTSGKSHRDGFKKPSAELSMSMGDILKQKSVPRAKSDAELDKKVKNILSELKVETGQSGLAKGIVGAVRMWGKSSHKTRTGHLIEEYYDQFREGGTNEESRGKEISLKSGPRSHLFDKIFKEFKKGPAYKPTLFELEQSDEIEKLKRMDIGTNDFEEMMKIADRQWKFPVDNEVVKVDEENIGFEEHVFLEYLLEEFPKEGPVRQFMELVVNGLQMNPHLSVQQKRDQVFWFKEYFGSFSEGDLNF